ncbi:MAG: hypothetical protein HYS27_04085 [Deltaproteobacteria bacterium]|nr:hypothetical protein [Deltaproteobacteria bacterium]
MGQVPGARFARLTRSLFPRSALRSAVIQVRSRSAGASAVTRLVRPEAVLKPCEFGLRTALSGSRHPIAAAIGRAGAPVGWKRNRQTDWLAR